ncbi:MAG: hypothetical protein GBAus27B_000358 [Mycoplasmataceae bacterium]|nr:MAG: hypothetical protein GBAus27B_000358 [Mycoplasmataceae bacterium]
MSAEWKNDYYQEEGNKKISIEPTDDQLTKWRKSGIIDGFQGQDFETVFAELNEDNQTQFTQVFVPKLEDHVKNLISDYSKDKESKFLTEIESLKPFLAYLTPKTKNQLTKLLNSIKGDATITATKASWFLIVGAIGVGLLIVGLMFWLIKKAVKKYW